MSSAHPHAPSPCMSGTMRVKLLAQQLGAVPHADRARLRRCERELVALYRTERGSRDAVIEAFLPFAMSFAIKLKRGEEPLDDLRQVALVGLLKALERFDAQRGESFTAYAGPTILGELRRHYRDTGWAVHVPRSGQELAQRITRAERHLTRDGRAPTAEAVADHLGTDVETVVEGRIAANAMRTQSLDAPVAGDMGPQLLADTRGADDTGYAHAENRATVAALADLLPEREKTILGLRYGEEQLSQREIGNRVGVSQMQVSRLLKRIEASLEAAVRAAG